MIELTLVQGNGFVFSPSDARVLREEHRIIGALVGSLPAHPHQNIHLGLPLQLAKEEVTLLLDMGLAKFKRRNNYPGHCTAEELSVYDAFTRQSLAEQKAESKRVRLEEIEANADKIVDGKIKTERGKKSKKTKKRKKNDEEEKEDESDTTIADVDPQRRMEILQDVKRRVQPATLQFMFIQTHNVNPFIDPEAETTTAAPCSCGRNVVDTEDEATCSPAVLTTCHKPLQTSQSSPPPPPASPRTSLLSPPLSPPPPRFAPVVWRHPTSGKERLKYATFKHFWSLGYFLTNGVKFGGDFLAYPGDPTRFHSFYVVRCLAGDEESTPNDTAPDITTPANSTPAHVTTAATAPADLKPHETTPGDSTFAKSTPVKSTSTHLTPADLVTMARLGTSVKKTLVLAAFDDDGELTLTSLELSHWN